MQLSQHLFTPSYLDDIIDRAKKCSAGEQGAGGEGAVREKMESPKAADALVDALMARMLSLGENRMLSFCGAPTGTGAGYLLTIAWHWDSDAPPAIQEGGRVYLVDEVGEKHQINSYDSALYNFMLQLQRVCFRSRNQIRALGVEGFEDLGQHLDGLETMWDEDEHLGRLVPDGTDGAEGTEGADGIEFDVLPTAT